MFAHVNNHLKNTSGQMLIELMLAVMLGLLVVSFLLQLYVASDRNYRLQMALNHIQDSATMAITILNTEIKRAGYVGCQHLTNDIINATDVRYSVTLQNKLIGNHAEITIRAMRFPNATLKETMQEPSLLYVDRNEHFSTGEKLMIADCKKAEIFQTASVKYTLSGQKITSERPLQQLFEKHAEVGRLEINRYFIARTHRKNTDGSAIYSLFVEKMNQRSMELVENIQRMQMAYFVLQRGELREVRPEEINDWSSVQAVGITFTVYYPPMTKIWYTFISLGEVNG
jgi:Tfp pilus assembly protein PilW